MSIVIAPPLHDLLGIHSPAFPARKYKGHHLSPGGKEVGGRGSEVLCCDIRLGSADPPKSHYIDFLDPLLTSVWYFFICLYNNPPFVTYQCIGDPPSRCLILPPGDK